MSMAKAVCFLRSSPRHPFDFTFFLRVCWSNAYPEVGGQDSNGLLSHRVDPKALTP
jgi:hypothetical protein